MKRLSISIAMCTYNGAQFIKDQLDSLAGQKRAPDEMVICDDGSDDATVEAIERFLPDAPFPTRLAVNKKNRGVTGNYEQAMAMCRGDVIAFADQDDIWHPEKLQRFATAFEERPLLGSLFSDATVIDAGGRPSGYTLWQSIRFGRKERDMVRSGRALDVLMKYNVASGATMAFNARLYKKLLLPIPRGCLGDHWMAVICSAIGELGMIEEPLIRYRKHQGQHVGPKGDGSTIRLLAGEARKCVSSGEYLVALKNSKRKEIDDALLLYGSAYRRLKKSGMLYSRPAVAERFEDKLAHLEARKNMAEIGRIRRIKPALMELAGLRYHRYSNGVAYPLEDLLA